MKSQDTGLSVLVTRPAQGGEDFADLLRARGHTPVMCPVMDITFRDAKVGLGGAAALAFTSANGVSAFARVSEARGLPVFAVGPVTAAAARAAGFSAVAAAQGDAGSLAALIAKAYGGKALKGEVIHVAGSRRAGDLAGALARAQISSRRVVLYDAKAVSALSSEAMTAVKNNPPHWAVFFSPRTARIFSGLASDAGLVGKLAQINAACLSEAVAGELNGHGWRSILRAKERSAEAMISLMEEHI